MVSTMNVIGLFSILLANCVLLIKADHWSYLEEDPNGVVQGKEEWGGQCRYGRRQSPIDLARAAAVMGRYSSLYFQNYENQLKDAKIRNTGHSLQIDIPVDQEYTLAGGGLPGIYRMDQMHFHWASEHTIDGRRYGLELHIVSHNQRYRNFSEAFQHKQGIAVLGVLFHISDKANTLLENILDSADAVKDEPGKSNDIIDAFSPVELLPSHRASYFRYEGSLTTPGCDEAVIWTVLDRTIPIATTQIERFQQVKSEDGALLTHNFRTLQRLNARTLVYVRNDVFYDSSSSNSVHLSIAALAAGIIQHVIRFQF